VKKGIITGVVFFIAILTACNNDVVLQKIKNFDNNEWAFTSPFKTNFALKDKARKYDIYFLISHSQDYPFQNIYLRITDDFSGKTHTDTVSIQLMNKNGYWKGEKKHGFFRYEVPLHKNFSFAENKDSFHIKIEQFTRQDTLKGVKNTGIVIKEIKK